MTRLVAPLAALLFAVVLFARGHPYDLDQLGLALPYARVLDDALRARTFPLWTDEIWCGYPVHAEGQGGFLAVPFRAVAALPCDEVLRLEVETALALVVAAACGAGGALLLGRSRAASATCGVLWALGGGLLAYQENPAVLEACSFLPLAVGVAATDDRRAGAVAGLLLGLVLLAGWPYAFLLGTPVVAVTFLSRGRWRGLGVALGVALAVGAAQWLPTAELVLRSERAGGLSPEEVLGQAPLRARDLARLVSWSIPLDERATDRSVVFAYVGAPAVLLALVGATRRRARGFVALLVVALALALLPAVAPAAGRALASVPPFSLVRGPAKLLILVGLAVAFLAAEGVDALGKGRWAACALVTLDLFVYGQRKALLVERDVLRAVPEVVAELPPGTRVHALEARSVPYALAREGPARFRRAATLEPNANVLWDVPIVGGYGPLAVGRSRTLALAPTLNHLARAAVPCIVAPPGRTLPAHEVARLDAARVYSIPALSRARIAGAAIVASASLGERGAFLLAGTAPLEQAVLEGPDGEAAQRLLARHTGEARGTCELERTPAGVVRARTRVARGPALLVLADTWYPGWQARVNGAPAAVLRAEYAFRAVVVPEGEALVELSYRPWTFPAGLAASALGFVLAGLAAISRRRSPGIPWGSSRRAGSGPSRARP